MKVGFLGPFGTYSHQATLQKFNTNLIPFNSIKETLDSLTETDIVVIPFENSTFGLVQQTLDYFRTIDERYRIYDQVYLEIHHCLLSKSNLEDIVRVYSHPEVVQINKALGQCSDYLSRLNVKIVPVDSTAKAAELVVQDTQGASISSLVCADMFGLQVLAQDIENQKNNTTRFFVIGKQGNRGKGAHGTLITCQLHGPLNELMRVFVDHKVVILNINSRPQKDGLWYRLVTRNYIYFIEFQGHYQDHGSLLKDIEQCVDRLQILGSFPLRDVLVS